MPIDEDYDAVDAAILNRLQEGIPISDAPFRCAAVELGISESEVVDRIRRLLELGVLSRFGPLYNVEQMGGVFTLVAAEVPEARFREVVDTVNAYPEVAHNYRREHRLNMWFVVATQTEAETRSVMEELATKTGLHLYEFPKLEEYHLGLHLDAGSADQKEE